MLNQFQFDQLVNKYPLIGKIFEVISAFKDILIKKDLKIKELDSYIKVLKNG